jgi:GNAT superfamily N-acetyltransferase
MKLTLENDPAPADIQAVRDGLDAFNQKHVGPDLYQPLNLFVRDGDGAVQGGLLGETFWDWLHISILWIDAGQRRKGLGARLLQQAEVEAVERGCKAVFVDTLSFQAPAFYLKYGYAVWGQLEGLPPGHRRIFYQKRLSADPSPS